MNRIFLDFSCYKIFFYLLHRATIRILWSSFSIAVTSARIFGKNVSRIMDFSDAKLCRHCPDAKQKFYHVVAHFGKKNVAKYSAFVCVRKNKLLTRNLI